MNAEEFDENRELCDDGNCLGVVVDGKCNVCGVAAAGTSPRDPGTGQTGGGGKIVGDDRGAEEMIAEGDSTFDDRQLCPDGACTGLIGSDGKCKECGRSASATAAS